MRPREAQVRKECPPREMHGCRYDLVFDGFAFPSRNAQLRLRFRAANSAKAHFYRETLGPLWDFAKFRQWKRVLSEKCIFAPTILRAQCDEGARSDGNA